MTDLGLSLTGKWLKEHGIGQTTIRNFLDGMNSSTTVETLSKLAVPLKTTERWLIFGGNATAISEEVLRAMVEDAVSEIHPGSSIADIREAVASSLYAQLRLHQGGGEVQSIAAAPFAPGTSVQSSAPTTEPGLAKPRSA